MDDTSTPVSSTEESELQTSSPSNLRLDPITWAAAGAVAKWVGEKAAGGLVSAAVGKVFSEVMDAIGLGGPDMVGKLDKISDQLVQVQKSLDRLTEMTAEILKQLAELKDFMEKSLKIETLVAAMTRIDVAYGSASDQLQASDGPTGRAISLRLLVEKMPHFSGVTQQQLKDAAKDFAAYVSDMPDKIETIHTVLAKQAFGQVSLLTHWTKELAQQVNAKKIGREAAYLVLEGYFLQAVSMQLKGVSVHCVALGTDPLGPEFIKEYIQDNFAKTMKNETSAFVEAVELLMFLTLKPTMPTGLQDGMGEREFPRHVDEILLRADLLSAALNLISYKADAGQPSPTIQTAIQGIYGRALFRPSDLNNETPPHLMIAGYTAAAPTGVAKPPFVCLDLIESNGRSELRDVNASPVTMAHYFWKFNSPEPAVGKPIFKYSGAKARVRLTASVTSIIERAPRKDGQGGTAFGQTWDVFNRLHLRYKGSQTTFYISVDSFGIDKPVSNQGSAAYSAWHENYKCRRDGSFTVDFDLEPGDYELAMQSEAAFWRGPQRYEGWQSTSLAFFLHGLSIERL